ncbi:hypothetical protein, partial [Anaplasma phagocytophilum]|uniref:hypothetical protein n=1 Tax=Anaplasma phagocytophilum TaxID=948 RepID=UPI00201AF4F0
YMLSGPRLKIEEHMSNVLYQRTSIALNMHRMHKEPYLNPVYCSTIATLKHENQTFVERKQE